MDKYNAAYINALSEERDPKILFEWIVKLHRENVDYLEALREELTPEKFQQITMRIWNI